MGSATERTAVLDLICYPFIRPAITVAETAPIPPPQQTDSDKQEKLARESENSCRKIKWKNKKGIPVE